MLAALAQHQCLLEDLVILIEVSLESRTMCKVS